MQQNRIYLLASTLLIASFILSSCGASNSTVIATSVAQTVQAQNDQATAAVTDTPLPLATVAPAATTEVPAPTSGTASTPLPANAGGGNYCTSAHFVADVNYPDGTIVAPGDAIWKTWRIQNTGTCTWTTAYRIVYDHGDLLGGGYVYNLPQNVPPGQTVDITIEFFAPTDLATYTGYWDLETPAGQVFGMDQYQVPFRIQVQVNSGTPGKNTATVYGVTSVVYDYSTSGCCTCGANVFLTTTAQISVSGPIKLTYYWRQSDGGKGAPKNLTFTEAGTVTVTDPNWPLGLGHELGLVWDEITITSPTFQVFTNTTARYDHECK
jgi:predicted secreted protein